MESKAVLRLAAIAVLTVLCALFARETAAEDRPVAAATPRIDSVVPLAIQPHESAPATIWHDDFDGDARFALYAEKGGDLTARMRLGSHGKSLEMRYPKGSRGKGGLKVFFGDSPTYSKQTVRKNETFTDVYWRVYVKHQRGWTGGGPAKLSRATSLVPPGWRQAMIAHVWSVGDALTLDPATGVRDGKVVTTKYNDFENLRWLGNRPASSFPLHSKEESGRWVCVEARARLNTPGKKDGLQQLWIDGRLESERTRLDWRGTWTGRGINAVFLEAYWNKGSPVDQSRWIDEFVVSTEPIGPVVCPRRPTLLRTAPRGVDEPTAWELEIAAGPSIPRFAKSAEVDIVWRSRAVAAGPSVSATETSGAFVGSRRGATDLAPNTVHFVRIREMAEDAPWSDWHQPFVTDRARE